MHKGMPWTIPKVWLNSQSFTRNWVNLYPWTGVHKGMPWTICKVWLNPQSFTLNWVNREILQMQSVSKPKVSISISTVVHDDVCTSMSDRTCSLTVRHPTIMRIAIETK